MTLQPDVRKMSSMIWFMVPLVAFFVIGLISGIYYEGQVVEKALLNTNLSVCKDIDGKVWIREQVRDDARMNNITVPGITI